MAGISHAAGVLPVAKSERNHLSWYKRQAEKKKAVTAKPGEFERELRKRLEGQK